MRPIPIVALLLLVTSQALAAPQITVKGLTVIRILGIQRDEGGAVLLGQLQDRDLGTGVSRRTVEVRFSEGGAARTVRVTTDDDGGFRVPLLGRGTSFRIEARFAGDLNYAGESYPAETLDVTKQSLELGLSVAGELDASQPGHPLQLRARAEGRPASVLLSLRTDRGRDLGRIRTDARGQARLRIETASLGEPGRVGLYVHFAGNDQLNPATRRFELTLFTPVRLSLRALEARIEIDDAIRLEGDVRDVGGALTGATVHLETLGRQVASTVSDSEGRFAFRLEAADYPPGRLDLIARYAPAVSWRRAATSPPVEVVLAAPRPIPLRLYLWPALFTVFLLLVLLTIRRWPALLAWWQTRHVQEEPGAPEEEPEPVRSGLRPSRSTGGLRALVRQSSSLWGTVWDPSDRCALPGVRLQLHGEHGESMTAETDARGRFRLESIPAGAHQVTVSLSGYVGERFPIQIPHRGHLHDVRIDLVQVRVRLLEVYRDAALPLLPSRELWARWTPRVLARHVGARAGRRQLPLEELTLLLERAYWSGHPPEQELVAEARRIAAGLPVAP